jgi:uroporphyrinogen-III synthase
MRAIVTRPHDQVAPLAAALRAAGFEPVVCPLIEIESIDDGPIDVRDYDWVVVTSVNGAAELARRRQGDRARVAAIGDATAAALEQHGIAVDFVPSVASQEGLIAEFPQPAGRVVFVGAEGARRLLAEQLPADFRAAYRTVESVPAESPSGDVVLLASPSAARAWAKVGFQLPAVTIGPQTTAAAQAACVKVVAEAQTPDTRGLVDSAAAWRDASSRS